MFAFVLTIKTQKKQDYKCGPASFLYNKGWFVVICQNRN